MTAERTTKAATQFKFAIPELNGDTLDQINGLYQQLVDKTPRNLLRASFYDGKFALRRIGEIIPPSYLRAETVLGWSAKAVDALARRCNLDNFFWPDGDFDSIGGTELWDDNFFATKANSGMVSSLLHGPAFLINTEGDERAGEPKSLIHVKSALEATGTWNSRRNGLDELLSITSRDDDGNPSGIALYEDGLTLTADLDEDGDWQVDIQTHKLGVPVEVLPYHPREDRALGSSRITRPAMSQQKRALKAIIRMDGHMDVYSFPQLILLGASGKAFRNKDGTLKAAWQVALARVFALEDDPDEPDAGRARADVKRFEAASPQPHIDALEQIAMLFAGETSITVEALGFNNRANPTSAESYIASREELIAEAEGATDDWSPAFRRSYMRGLAIKNGEPTIPKQWKSIDARFRSPLYLSKAAQADAGAKQLGAGPEWLKETEVGLELLGLDPQQIKRALAEKRRGNSTSIVDALIAANSAGDQPAAGDNAAAGDQPADGAAQRAS
ncbi:phage portal protein [Mycolicibacterium komossense]|uniref:Phage portal protein n=1 Tax=Mycolicibacterium komossense TaxID=1779 RepID=A0ABT3C9F6_9MYCO|nr:phage portal protein [Mycolicibacterium komossense]MCV7226068.1 phage portal protein [Mycolicibacterium komossense]